jgi:two-component system chemotaxis sensor kinase CheA
MDDGRKTPDDYTSEQMVAELRATFREEAYELVAELENALLELEEVPDDRELIGRAFRAMHTLKGSGGACEFHDIVSFTHNLETIFDRVRSGDASADAKIISLILGARDQIKAMLDRYYYGGQVDEAKSESILAELQKLVPDTIKEEKAPHKQAGASAGEGRRAQTFRIRFRPDARVFYQGTDPLRLLEELRSLGPCTIMAQVEALPDLEDMDPRLCYTFWDAVLSTDKGKKTVEDVFIFARESSELRIDVIDDSDDDPDVTYKRIGEILLERGDLSAEELRNVLKAKKRVGELLVETGVVKPSRVESALVEQQRVREAREQRQNADSRSSIRVATEKLDTLVNLVGELVTAQARLSQTAASFGAPELVSVAEEIERLTASLRDNAMNIRMLPIGTTFSKFRRLVRDLSSELGKDVELATDGAETELDKTVIERLSDPLVHIIRNSIDHGVEVPSVREAAGKPRTGSIRLSAVHSGAHVLISIEDDGAGLDREAILAKAVEKGIIRADRELTEKEQYELILAPGFSTAKKVTGVSGRGVGMDVVKRAIDALRGSIEIESTRGRGTKITLKLPLTLAIIDGFLTRVGGEHFIFPLSLVEECVELRKEDGSGSRGRHVAHVRGTLVPYIRLRDHFQIAVQQETIEQIVITNVDGARVGFVVDVVVGEHQTVLKSLGRLYRTVEGISGATILGDGTVALILDIPKLVRIVERLESGVAEGRRQ